MDVVEIIEETEKSFHEVLTLEALVRAQASSQGIDPMAMRYADGSMAMAPLVIAKTKLLDILYDYYKDKPADGHPTGFDI